MPPTLTPAASSRVIPQTDPPVPPRGHIAEQPRPGSRVRPARVGSVGRDRTRSASPDSRARIVAPRTLVPPRTNRRAAHESSPRARILRQIRATCAAGKHVRDKQTVKRKQRRTRQANTCAASEDLRGRQLRAPQAKTYAAGEYVRRRRTRARQGRPARQTTTCTASEDLRGRRIRAPQTNTGAARDTGAADNYGRDKQTRARQAKTCAADQHGRGTRIPVQRATARSAH